MDTFAQASAGGRSLWRRTRRPKEETERRDPWLPTACYTRRDGGGIGDAGEVGKAEEIEEVEEAGVFAP
jgi:hypothetical protein